MRHLKLNTYDFMGHPIHYMYNLGITYKMATPQSLGDQWWFWNCDYIPDHLPNHLEYLDVNPYDMVGMGLSEKDAAEILEYQNRKYPFMVVGFIKDDTHLAGLFYAAGSVTGESAILTHSLNNAMVFATRDEADIVIDYLEKQSNSYNWYVVKK